VFWLAENNFPELMVTFDDEPFDPEKQAIGRPGDLFRPFSRAEIRSTLSGSAQGWISLARSGACRL